jgi:hypothetical protein
LGFLNTIFSKGPLSSLKRWHNFFGLLTLTDTDQLNIGRRTAGIACGPVDPGPHFLQRGTYIEVRLVHPETPCLSGCNSLTHKCLQSAAKIDRRSEFMLFADHP